MTTNEITTTEKGKKVTIKSVKYIIVQVSEKLLWLKRENGKQIYRTGYYTKNGQIFVNGLPVAM